MESPSLMNVKDKLKQVFHEDIKTTMEITGGVWDATRNIYSITDKDSGVISEYQLKKNKSVETGTSVRVHSYKEAADQTGTLKRTEVIQNPQTRVWEEKSKFAKAKDALTIRPKLMATLKASRNAESNADTYSLVVSPVKFKQREQPPIIVMPPIPPMQNGTSRI